MDGKRFVSGQWSSPMAAAMEYLKHMQDVFDNHPGCLFHYMRLLDEPVAAARRIARALGHGLRDSHLTDKELFSIMGTLYGRFLVRYCVIYHVLVPVSNRVFIQHVQEAYAEMIARWPAAAIQTGEQRSIIDA